MTTAKAPANAAKASHYNAEIDAAEAELAELEAMIQAAREARAIERIAHRKKFGTDLPAYTSNADAQYNPQGFLPPFEPLQTGNESTGPIYVGARVRVRGYGGIGEVIALNESGLTNRKGMPVYKADVVFNTTGRQQTKVHEFWASHCTNIHHVQADATAPACDLGPDALRTALADLDRQIAKLNK